MNKTLLCLCAGLTVGASFPLTAQETKKPLPLYVYLFAHYVFVSMLQWLGIEADNFGSSAGTVKGLEIA